MDLRRTFGERDVRFGRHGERADGCHTDHHVPRCDRLHEDRHQQRQRLHRCLHHGDTDRSTGQRHGIGRPVKRDHHRDGHYGLCHRQPVRHTSV